jgi:hypothetical protein
MRGKNNIFSKALLLCSVSILITACSTNSVPDKAFSQSVSECVERIDTKLGTINPLDFLEIKMTTPAIKEETDTSVSPDNKQLNTISYEVKFRNIGNNDINFSTKIYPAKVISENFLLNSNPIQDTSKDPVVLIPGQGFICQVQTLIMKRTNFLDSDKMLKLYDDNLNYLYVEVKINNDFGYLIINPK